MKWLSTKQYAELMGIHPYTVMKMCREGSVPSALEVIRIGNRWRIRVDD